MTTYTNARGQGLERAYSHWRERGALLDSSANQTKDSQLGITIAISRERGAGGGSIAHLVAEQLGWPVYDHELVDKIAEDAEVRSRLLDKLDEKRPNWLAECLESIKGERHVTGVGFAIRLRKILLALYSHGNCVVLGRGAAQVLPEKRVSRIRLIAPMLYRIPRATDHLGISEEAAREVAEIDRQREDFVKSYFHKDPADVHEYDLTLDTSRFSQQDCRDLILAALSARQARLSTPS